MLVSIVIDKLVGNHPIFNHKHKINALEYNRVVARQLYTRLHQVFGISSVVVDPNSNDNLVNVLNKLNPNFTIFLSYNHYDGTLQGTQVEYYFNSILSNILGNTIKNAILDAYRHEAFPNMIHVGGSIGESVLSNLKTPTAIIKPFYIDNDDDMARFAKKYDYVCALSEGINTYIKQNKELL